MIFRRTLSLPLALAVTAAAADLPIREVILYKHGVAFFERAGQLNPGETARLDFKAGDMNDVLKSLTLTDPGGGKIAGVRYDASETVEKRLQDFPFDAGAGSSLAAFLDRMKGARLEIMLGTGSVEGTIVGARLIRAADPDKIPERETVVLLMDSGSMRVFDLGAAGAIRFPDPKLQNLLRDYLGVLSQARSRDRRSVYVDSAASSPARDLIASYMTPAAVWKSSYRLIFGKQGEPALEGWAIIDNTSGDDWTNVRLSVVSGRPISFITQLYEPRYVTRPGAELAENRPVAPIVFQGALADVAAAAPVGKAMAALAAAEERGNIAAQPENRAIAGRVARMEASSVAAVAQARDAGELFEYSFSSPVTVKKGESAMLPFLQQKVGARKLLIYSESYGLNPMNAAEITNSTGKTLDGGPITVYDDNTYAGEALVETVKAGDKRLISYGVDLGTRITTAFDSSRDVVREIHLRRGMLTTRSAVEEVRTFTVKNVDAKAKTLIIEHPQRPGYKLISTEKPIETTSNAYRFEVKVGASAAATFAVREERVFDQTTSITNVTPDTIATWVQNKTLSDAARQQLQQIAQKKTEVAANEAALRGVQNDLTNLTQDEGRIRSNISSLNSVSGQQDQVQQYARQLAAAETRLAGLRDRQSELGRRKAVLESELNSLMEKLDF